VRHSRARLRYGRIALAATAAVVTAVAVLGGLGLTWEDSSLAAPVPADALGHPDPSSPTTDPTPVEQPPATAAASTPAGSGTAPGVETSPSTRPALERTALPARSGSGRRVVFSQSRQRVWLVGTDGRVVHTHLASGSAYDNLEPGSYEVWSRSRHAVGVADSGTMQYFVRFARGDTGAAIGFHDIPVDDGERVQTVDQLGTPLSHGCIRQRRPDARRTWDFAPLGTPVVVTA
jgi:lipoprotein-anchoring transpeptidase ErfK/SrfK